MMSSSAPLDETRPSAHFAAMPFRRRLPALVGAVLLPATGSAQLGFQARAIRLIVPVAPGGSQDIVARLLARHMAEPLGQPIIVENKPGAAGNIGLEIVARARPDGLTMGAGSDNLSINKALFPWLAFDPVEDFAAVAQATLVPQMLVVRTDSPFTGLASFLDAAGRQPLAMGSGGNGSLAHLLQHMLQGLTGRHWTHVPYRGGAPALNDLLAGSLHAMMGNVGAVAGAVAAGLVRGLAISSDRRAQALPQVPSFAELGLPQATIMGWHGLVAPRDTPAGIVALLHAAALHAIRQPVMRERLAAIGITPSEAPPAELVERMRADAQRWVALARRGGLGVE